MSDEEHIERLRELEHATEPFLQTLTVARRLGHYPGTSCTWRFKYDDLQRLESAMLALAADMPIRTKSGRVLTDEDFEALADEAERGYDVSKLRPRHATRADSHSDAADANREMEDE